MVENGKFLNRLRKGHLEKSAATGLFRPSRSPMTAKTSLKVHLRLRFPNLGKPRTAGLCGRAAGACDCGPLSCAKIERPSPLKKPSCKVRFFAQNHSRKYRQKVTVTTLFPAASYPDFQLLTQTAHVCFRRRKRVHTRLSEKDRTQRLTRRSRGLPFLDTAGLCVTSEISLITAFVTIDSTVLLYTYISRFSVTPQHQQKKKICQSCCHSSISNSFSTSRTNGLRSFSQVKAGTLGFRRRIAHKRLHGETRGVSDGGAISTLGAFRTFRKPCVAKGENGELCRFWALAGGALEERREPSEQRYA